MNPAKLPSKEAKSLSFLAYSLACLVLSNVTSDPVTKKVFWFFALISFLLAAIKFIKDNLKFPLVPCKNRCDENSGFICIRDKGFYLGCFVSIATVLIIKLFQFDFPVNKITSLFIAIICTLATIIHGTLRRHIGILSSGSNFDRSLTFISGFITGLGIFFVAVYFI